jgi:hypothetical protein
MATALNPVHNNIHSSINSVPSWRNDIICDDKHPELMTFIAYQISKFLAELENCMFNQIFEAHSHIIYILLDKDDKINLFKELLAMAREARQQKQAERIQKLQERGIRLQNWHAQIHVPNPSPEDMDAAPGTLLDEAVLDTDVDYNATEATATQFLNELNALTKIPKYDAVDRRFDKFPTVLRFAFLISSTSRAALRLATNFMPLPCPNTVYNHFLDKLKDAESALSNIEKLVDQIATSIEMN